MNTTVGPAGRRESPHQAQRPEAVAAGRIRARRVRRRVESRAVRRGSRRSIRCEDTYDSQVTFDNSSMAHFDGRRYFNPTGANGQPFWALPRLLRTTWTPWPRSVPTHPRRPPEAVGAGEAGATFIGHATFLIQTAAGNILTDPMYSERAGPLTFFGPRRVRCPGVAFEDLPPISVVVVSHNHYDHFDRRTLQVLGRRFDPLVVTPLGNGRLLQAAGIRRVEELDWWQETTASSPLAVTVTPAQHFSARTPFDRNRALWGGFVIA